jgi:hypothetical protein
LSWTAVAEVFHTTYPRWRRPGRHDRQLKGRGNWGYCCECAARDAVLLPSGMRNWLVPVGRGGMGQTRVRYFEPSRRWMQQILDQIDEYDGPPLVGDPAAEAEDVASCARACPSRRSRGDESIAGSTSRCSNVGRGIVQRRPVGGDAPVLDSSGGLRLPVSVRSIRCHEALGVCLRGDGSR